MQEKTPEVVVQANPADEGLRLPGLVLARCADGLDAVEIRFRYDGATGPKRSLRLLAKAALEVLVTARAVDGTHVPAQVEATVIRDDQGGIFVLEPDDPRGGFPSREAEGTRWHG